MPSTPPLDSLLGTSPDFPADTPLHAAVHDEQGIIQDSVAELPGEGDQSAALVIYRICFRRQGQEFSAAAELLDCQRGDLVIVRTEHGVEPAIVLSRRKAYPGAEDLLPHHILRRASEEEQEKYTALLTSEREAAILCKQHIAALQLAMHLVRVERFFNGSKIIFYFTAESRIDFRELVKVLVREFRTRVEMRQIGVRHETQMIGGLGPCGRELCCNSFLNKFDSVSIKMAKTQDLSLNPAKISGLCNRLLCCLTYEYETYRSMKKGMPKVGRSLQYEGKPYTIIRQLPLLGKVAGVSANGEERFFSEGEWQVQELPQTKSVLRKPFIRKGESRQYEGDRQEGQHEGRGERQSDSHHDAYYADLSTEPSHNQTGELESEPDLGQSSDQELPNTGIVTGEQQASGMGTAVERYTRNSRQTNFREGNREAGHKTPKTSARSGASNSGRSGESGKNKGGQAAAPANPRSRNRRKRHPSE